MNKNNIILLVIICVVLTLLYLYMQHQIKSTENLLESTSLNSSPAIQKPTVTLQPRKTPLVQEPKQTVRKHIEIDDGLDIPPDKVKSVMFD